VSFFILLSVQTELRTLIRSSYPQVAGATIC
jgi:hypothetical protein